MVVSYQSADGRRGPYRHALVEGGFGETAGERITVHQANRAAVKRHVAQKPQKKLGDVEGRDRRAGDVEEMQQFLPGADHHAEEGDFLEGRAQTPNLVAELAPVERSGDDRSAAIHAAGCRRMIVGEEGAEIELQRGFALVEVDGFGPSFEEGVNARRIEMLAGLVLEIFSRIFNTVLDACAFRGRAAGDPAPAARARGGAAEHRLLFGDDHGKMAMRAANSGREAAGARADHEDVDFLTFHAVFLHDAR